MCYIMEVRKDIINVIFFHDSELNDIMSDVPKYHKHCKQK